MKKLALVVLLVLTGIGCQEGDDRFQHQGEYAITWTVQSTTCAAGVELPDLVYVGQYPEGYPDKVGLASASFYYSTFGAGKMTALDAEAFGADFIALPDFDMFSLSDTESLHGFVLEFSGQEVNAVVNATRADGCTTVYQLHGAVNALEKEGIQ